MTWPQYRRRECTACGFTVALSPMQAEILLVLMLRFPGPVSSADLVEAVWHDDLWDNPDAEPVMAVSTIEVTLRRLCAKIGGFHIAGRRGFGWRLVQAPET